MRWIAKKLGIEKIIIRNNTMICSFIKNQDSPFYQSAIFLKIINFTQTLGSKAMFKEQKDKLSITFYHINSIKDSLSLLLKINV